MQQFRGWMVEEGDTLDAIKHGIKVGFKAFTKMKQQKAQEKQKEQVASKITTAATDADFAAIAKELIANGLDIAKNGAVVEKGKADPNSWLLEHVRSQQRRNAKKVRTFGSSRLVETQTRKLVGNPYIPYPQF